MWHRCAGLAGRPPHYASRNAGYDCSQSLRLEVQRHAIDAITQMRGGRPIFEHVAEMAAAAAAVHFRAHHPEAAVAGGFDRARNRVVEAWPAGAALELRLRDEQRLPAADAGKG